MFNMLKMDLYKMFHLRSLYVIWIIMSAFILLSIYLLKQDYDMIEVDLDQGTISKETADEEADEDGVEVEVGLVVSLPDDVNNKVTLYDLIFANTGGNTVALFLVIFAVMLTMADFGNGYIKNIAGQVPDRGMLVIAKMCSLFIYTILTFVLYVIMSIIGSLLVFSYLEPGNIKELLIYLGVQVMLHFALAVICMTVSYVTKNTVISMTISICIVINFMTIIYDLLDIIINKFTKNNFEIIKYTVTGNISLLQMNPTGGEVCTALVSALAFVTFMTFISYHVFRRRDI